jgi:hypothetical protein
LSLSPDDGGEDGFPPLLSLLLSLPLGGGLLDGGGLLSVGGLLEDGLLLLLPLGF